MNTISGKAAAMTERLIDAAVYNEQASGVYVSSARKELNEARAAIEAALAKPASEPAGGDVREALKAALERAANAESMLEAWFDLAKKTEAEATPIILDGLKGYLRTSRSGGMPADLSNRVEAVLEDYCGKYLGRALVPVLRGIAALSSSAGPAEQNWKDDPTSDERWNAGCDFAMTRLCDYLGVDPSSVRWDAATETVDGDVSAVIGNIFTARFGEDWFPSAHPAPATVESALRRLAVALHEKHYSHVTQWRPLEGDVIGLITQIDNMTAALAPATEGRKS